MHNLIHLRHRAFGRAELLSPMLAAALLLGLSFGTRAEANTVTVASPAVNQTIAPANWVPGIINGSASDGVGISGVSVKLFRAVGGTKEFWNGSAYVTTSTALAATLGTPGGTSTTWSLTGPDFPSAAELGLGSFSVVVSATDASANISVAVTRNFMVTSDSAPPVVNIVNPGASMTFSPASFSASTVDGNVTDDEAVDSINLKLFRTDGSTKYFWNGSAFVTTPANAPVSTTGLGTTSATWSLTTVPPAGNMAGGIYTVQVTAKDSATNVAVGSRQFRVITDSAPPVAIISTPASNGHLLASSFTIDTITGRATDDIGATSVSVKLYHTVGGVKYYWNGSAFTTANVSVAAVISGSEAVNVNWKLATAPSEADLTPGTYGIQAGAKDASGKASAFVTRNFVIDPPSSGSLRKGSGKSF